MDSCHTTLESRGEDLGVLDENESINPHGQKYGTALQAASFDGSREVDELLLTRGADINAKGGEYGTALQIAASRRHRNVVELLPRTAMEVLLLEIGHGVEGIHMFKQGLALKATERPGELFRVGLYCESRLKDEDKKCDKPYERCNDDQDREERTIEII